MNQQKPPVDKSQIIIMDDVFPKWFQDHLEKLCKEMEWTYVDILGMNDSGPENYLSRLTIDLNYNIFNDYKNITEIVNDALTIDVIPKMVPTCQIKCLVRMRFNGILQGFDLNPHIDNDNSNIWVFVYYINESDGDTIFYDHDHSTEIARCEFKKGRAVIFPADIYHKAEAPKNSKLRLTLGVTYLMDV